MNLVEVAQSAIEAAEKEESKITAEVLQIDGMSSPKVRHLLNNLCAFVEEPRYLEIGVWKGSTLISAAYGNVGVFLGIDNWSTFGHPKGEFLKNVDKFYDDHPFMWIDNNCWEVNLKDETLPRFNIYFYDGKHHEEDQYKAFTYYDPILEDTFIAVVDDWNHEPTRLGTERALRELNYKELFRWERRTTKVGDRADFWNGMLVLVLEKQHG